MTLNHSKIEITSGNFKRMLGRIYFESVKSMNYDTGNSMLRILAEILKMLTSFLPWKRYSFRETRMTLQMKSIGAFIWQCMRDVF